MDCNVLTKNNYKMIRNEKTKWVLLCLVSILLGFASCKKKENAIDNTSPTQAQQNTPKGTLMFHLHTYIDQEEVDLYNIPYTTSAGRNISLSKAQMYISSIQLEKLDGTLIDVSGKKVLKTLEAETYNIGDVAVGNYKSVRFKIGLDASTNASNPTASSDSVVLNKPDMWYGSTAQPDGYVFLNVQGSIDTSAGMAGPLIPFSYKIGTSANYKQVVMPDKNYTITEGQATFVHVIVDYSRIFDNIQLNQVANLTVASPADNSTSLTQQIVNNIPAMFSYEQ